MSKDNIKSYIFYIILLSVFLTLFKLADSSISLTYGDFVSFFIAFIFIDGVVKKKYRFPKFAKYWVYYVLVLVFSAVLNLTFFDGPFLNIFKTNVISLMYFVIVYSLVLKNGIKANSFIKGIGILGIAFLIKTWPQMQEAWAASEVDFTNVGVYDSSLNLNTWGFVLVLFLIIMVYAWFSKIYSRIALISCVIIVAFIFFSYSRTAYSLVGLILVWSIFYINKFNIKNLIFPLVIIGLVFIFQNQLNFFDFKVSETALTFWENKSGSYGEDLVNTRFYLINIKPLIESYESFNPFQMLLGDGISVQHSIVSHALIVSGIIGFIVYMKRFIYVFRFCIYRLKRNIEVVQVKFLMLLILVVLINDFITNASSFLPFAAYLSSIIMAFFFADIDSHNTKQYKG